MQDQLAAYQRRKARREEPYEVTPDQNETFAYIAGYTVAGFAYGVTWEDWEARDVIDLDGKTNTTGNDEPPEPLPF